MFFFLEYYTIGNKSFSFLMCNLTRVLLVRINHISVSDQCIFTVIWRWWRIIKTRKETQFTNRSFCNCLLDTAWLVYSSVNYLPQMVSLIWWISRRLSSTGINPTVRLPGTDVSKTRPCRFIPFRSNVFASSHLATY